MKNLIRITLGVLLFSASLSMFSGCALMVEMLGFGEVGALAVESRALMAARAGGMARRAALLEGAAGRAAITRTATGRLLITDKSALVSQASRVRVSTALGRNPRLHIIENRTKIEIGEIEATNSIKIYDTKTRYLFNNGRLVHAKQKLNVLDGPGNNYKALYSIEKNQLILKLQSNYAGWDYVAMTVAGATVYGYVREGLLDDTPIANPVTSKSCDECSGKGRFAKRLACNDCGGGGQARCSECLGTGQRTCNICKGAKQFTCNICHGKKQFVCNICQGKTQFVCNICQGNKQFVCNICQGKRRLSCNICQGSGRTRGYNGVTQCTSCRGAGSRACNSCRQTGVRPCNSCRQSGVRPCNSCRQSGVRPCNSCRQTGIRSCNSCREQGKTLCSWCTGKGVRACNKCRGFGEYESYTDCNKCEGSGKIYFYASERH